MRILLTNDDGIYAPGIRALHRELAALGEVTLVAPAAEQSAVGHSITLLTPLIVQEVRDENHQPIGWAVEGKPADCVKLALRELLPGLPDLVISGINAGSNAGINVLYSGTVAAAIEGAFFGVTSMAISLDYKKPVALNFGEAARIGRQVIEQILSRQPPRGSLFNINIPSLENGPPRGIKVVPQEVERYEESYDRRRDPRGRVYFWITSDIACPGGRPHTDVGCLAEGYVAVTPLKFDLTHRGLLEQMQSWAMTLEPRGR
ncbi:MAG: 5'/3'-nucleotidase SurE [Gemmataceae bacterium]